MTNLRWIAACATAPMPLAAHTQAPATPTMPTMPAMPTMPGAAPGGQQDMTKMMQLAAHNQLGVVEYRRDQGSVGDDMVAVQKRMLTMLPPVQVEGPDAAEAVGRKSMVQFAGNALDIKRAAQAQNKTPGAMCKQVGSMLQAQTANLPKQGPETRPARSQA